MFKHALAALLLILGAGSAAAYDTPEALLEALYAPYLDETFDWSDYDVFALQSAELNELYQNDIDESEGEIGRIDFDPYIDAQDYGLTDLKIGAPQLEEGTATVEVTFDNLDRPTDLLFTLIEEKDGWKIDDVVFLHEPDRKSLKALLSAPL